MSYGNIPGGEQDDLGGPPPPGLGGFPPYPGQYGAAGPPGWAPGPQVPPGYGPPGYGPPGYGAPGYYPPGYGAPMYAPPGPPPPTYGGWAVSALIGGVLFSLLVGLPAAIAGRVYGAKVSRLWASGDMQGAYSASRRARGWLTASTVFDLLGLVLVTFLLVTHSSSSPVYFSNTPAAVPVSVSAVPASVPAQQPVQTVMMDGCHGHMR
jgi:Interferon-induced transmembrane protein